MSLRDSCSEVDAGRGGGGDPCPVTPLLVLTNQTATLAVGTNDADPGHVRGARARQVHLHTAAVVHGVDALALRTPSLGIELRTELASPRSSILQASPSNRTPPSRISCSSQVSRQRHARSSGKNKECRRVGLVYVPAKERPMV